MNDSYKTEHLKLVIVKIAPAICLSKSILDHRQCLADCPWPWSSKDYDESPHCHGGPQGGSHTPLKVNTNINTIGVIIHAKLNRLRSLANSQIHIRWQIVSLNLQADRH